MDKKFKFLFDPIFLFSSSLYIINKAILSNYEFWKYNFFKNYLNDILLVPVLVPIILFFLYVFKFRKNPSPPVLLEILLPLGIWAIAFEIIGPFYFGKGTSDPIDVLAYCFGGLISWEVWKHDYFAGRK